MIKTNILNSYWSAVKDDTFNTVLKTYGVLIVADLILKGKLGIAAYSMSLVNPIIKQVLSIFT